MAEATARAILALGRGQTSGHYLVDHGEEFIYDCDEDAAYAWNQLSGGLPEAVQGDYDNGVITFHYRGKQLPLSLRHNRGDGLLQMHALAMLVREDSELRICLDSVGNSELAFLPLPPAVWVALEQEFGQELVDYRFMRLPDDADAIEPALEALDVLSREYPDEYVPPPPPDPKGVAAEAALIPLRALLEPHYPEIKLGWTKSGPKPYTLKLHVTTRTDAEMEQLRTDKAMLLQLRPVLRELCRQVEGYFRGFSYGSEEKRQRIIRDRTGELLGGPVELPTWWNKPDPAPQASPQQSSPQQSSPQQPAPVATPALQLVAIDAPEKPAATVAAQPGAPAAAVSVAKPVAKAAAVVTAATPAKVPTPKPLAPPPPGGLQVACPNCNTRFNVRPTALSQPLFGAMHADCPGCGWRINLGFTASTRALIWLPVLFFLGMNLIGSNAVAHFIVTLLALLFAGPLMMERKVRQRIVKRG